MPTQAEEIADIRARLVALQTTTLENMKIRYETHPEEREKIDVAAKKLEQIIDEFTIPGN